ncbi:uncharacterized protein LOC107266095 [Cephus cinctus]|uniref:Uncharacterized protein LOC107266095 n=1 Tax=Cephus cinctus TaxID=211228 RepID=A0AAJ7BQ78_CEPCN|nr:uncharacterized protein LOC107266095 [Cephus cinctus]
MNVKILLVATCLLGYFGTNALHCYECNSHNNSQCAENILPDALKKDCVEHVEGAKYTMCRKIVQVIEFSVNGLPANTRVIRSCGWDETAYKGRCYQRGGFGGRQEVCSCTTDYCNAATTSIPTSWTLMILSFLGSLIAAFARY